MLFAVLAVNVMHDAAHGTLIGPSHVSPVVGGRLNAWIARAITAPIAARHGLPYRVLTYRELVAAQRRFLKQMGGAAR